MQLPENLQYPIGKDTEQPYFDSSFDERLKDQLISDIKVLPALLEHSILNLNDDKLDTPYRPGGWTVKQLVHHVADSHINAYMRFKLALTEDNPTVKPYNQDLWALLSDTQTVPINVSLTLLHSLHIRWVALMNEMKKDEWERTIYHPESKVNITLWELLKYYSWHCRHHTAHITALRERMGWS
jgi:uncharacterized damage-inducible protein DinB